MEQLKVNIDDAKKAFKIADAQTQSVLKGLFGETAFEEAITDKVKSFEDACQILGLDPHSIFNANDSDDEIAYKKIKVIAQALNQGWKPDWTNAAEYKWTPWFDLRSGSGLSFYACDYWTRVRLSALAFASKRKRWPNTRGNNFWISTPIFSS
jgi:hypothetical protein